MTPITHALSTSSVRVLNVHNHLSLTKIISVDKGLPGLMSEIFNIAVIIDDNLSPYACRTCVSSAQSIHYKLQRLRAIAKKSYEKVSSEGSSI